MTITHTPTRAPHEAYEQGVQDMSRLLAEIGRILIEAIGASGPELAEETARRAVARIHELEELEERTLLDSILVSAQVTSNKALEHYTRLADNSDGQVDMCIEECSELIKVLLKHRRAKQRPSEPGYFFQSQDIREELADVQIMVFQMQRLFGWQESMGALEEKTQRLEIRMGNIGKRPIL